MPATLTDTSSRVFLDVSERMLFMFGERLERHELPPSPESALIARMAFVGPVRGTIGLAASRAACLHFAHAAMGTNGDEAADDALGIDALRELVNVLCGNLLVELAGDDAVFEVSVPVVNNLTSSSWGTMADQKSTLAFAVDEHTVLLQITTKQ